MGKCRPSPAEDVALRAPQQLEVEGEVVIFRESLCPGSGRSCPAGEAPGPAAVWSCLCSPRPGGAPLESCFLFTKVRGGEIRRVRRVMETKRRTCFKEGVGQLCCMLL